MEGNTDKSRSVILKAKELNSDTNALRARILTNLAGRLLTDNNLDESIKLLIIAGELYPQDASIPEMLGEIFLEKSRRYLNDALQLDPTRENSRDQLKKIK